MFIGLVENYSLLFILHFITEKNKIDKNLQLNFVVLKFRFFYFTKSTHFSTKSQEEPSTAKHLKE